ncbi:major facilitator superfamily domain-containing protein [Aspergillus cavernicola]|uniref:Major facilitator superfamily domain-containing protein n=1 Tax=Aspergillus cavernicola TaxID=176166 RepID=A0ABR4HIE0_9EURO
MSPGSEIDSGSQYEQKCSHAHLEKAQSAEFNTVHGDEAMKSMAAYAGDREWEPEEEEKLVRRIDRKLLPIMALSYGLQYYDKTLLSQAAIFGLREDLGLFVGNRYSMAASMFYLGWISGAYPTIYTAQLFPIERVCAAVILIWGGVLMAAAACTNFQGFYAQRFFLGFLEAGIAPMFMLVIGGWYKKNEQALRMGIWYCFTGYISMFTPLINFGLGHLQGALSPWQYMFLCAGAVTVLWSIVVLLYLPGDPTRSRGFSERETYIAVARLRSNNTGVRNLHFKSSQVLDALSDLRFWLIISIATLTMITNGPQSTFQAIIVNSFGFSRLNSLLLLMPFGFIIGTIQLVGPYVAYKYANLRTYIVIACQCLTIMSSLLLWLLPRSELGGLLVGIYFLGSFGGAYVVLMIIQVANTAGYTKRAFTSAGIFIAYSAGNVIGPLLFRSEDAPRYVTGWTIVVVTQATAAVLTLVYRYFCMWENQRRDRSGIMESYDHAFEDDLTDQKNPQFRYVY